MRVRSIDFNSTRSKLMLRLKVSVLTLTWLTTLFAAVPTVQADLIVFTSRSEVWRLDDVTGGLLTEIAPPPQLSNLGGMAFGADGDIFVTNSPIPLRSIPVPARVASDTGALKDFRGCGVCCGGAGAAELCR